jgi:acetolactate decarboxylase
MKRFLIKTLLIIILFASASCAQQGVITQVSTIDALMTGVYDGEVTLADLKQKGDFGVGTFNTLDGEMVLLEGQFYRATAAGTVEQPDFNTKTPFAAVTFFRPDRTASLSKGLDFQEFTQQTDRQIPTSNIFYAIKITGTFEIVKTRSVPPQKKPYKSLSEVVKTQPVFDLKHLKGTIIGFRCPPYVKGVNVPGYHLHFLSADHTSGGHVLEFRIEKGTLEIGEIKEFFLMLPSDKAFYNADLSQDRGKELKTVEKE